MEKYFRFIECKILNFKATYNELVLVVLVKSRIQITTKKMTSFHCKPNIRKIIKRVLNITNGELSIYQVLVLVLTHLWP